MRRLRRILAWLVVPMVFAVAAAVGGLYLLPRDDLVAETVRQFRALTGQTLQFDGPATVALWPVPGIRTGPVRVPGRPGAGRDLLRADAMVVLPAPLALLKGEVRPGLIALTSPEITLGTGTGWHIAERADGLTLGWLRITGGTVRAAYPGLTAQDFTRVDLFARLGALADPAHISAAADWRGRHVAARLSLDTPLGVLGGTGGEIDASLASDEDSIAFRGTAALSDAAPFLVARGTLTGTIAQPAAYSDIIGLVQPAVLAAVNWAHLEADLHIVPDDLRVRASAQAGLAGRTVSLRATLRGSAGWQTSHAGTLELVSRSGGLYSVHAAGRVDPATWFAGESSVSVLDLPAFQDWLGIPREDRLVVAARAAGTATLTLDGGAIRLADAALTVDDRAVGGSLVVDPGGDRTSLTGSLALGRLDLTALHRAGWDRLRGTLAQIEAAGTDIAVAVSAKALRIGDVVLENVEAGLSNREGTATLEVARLDALGGVLTGHVGLATTGAARLDAEIAAAEIDAATIARRAGVVAMTGAVSAALEISLADLTAPGTGAEIGITGSVSVLDGMIAMSDVAATARGETAPAQVTRFRSLEGRVSYKDGRFAAGDVKLRTDGLALDGSFTTVPETGLLGGTFQGAVPGSGGGQAPVKLDLGGTPAAPVLTRETPLPVESAGPAGTSPLPAVTTTTTADAPRAGQSQDAAPAHDPGTADPGDGVFPVPVPAPAPRAEPANGVRGADRLPP